LEKFAVEIPQRKKDPIVFVEDEFMKPKTTLEALGGLRAAFKKDGSVTAGNSSGLNDGAVALLMASGEAVKQHGLKPLARIVSFADAAQAPEWFTTAPAKAIPVALAKAGLSVGDIDFWELNQAFAVVGLANTKELGLNPTKVDVNGGAVALGHPLGSSGSRIIVTLLNVLRQNGGRYGAAGICNGGGGASAMVIEAL
jgi:acetyl-CoA C-acetyltransferase